MSYNLIKVKYFELNRLVGLRTKNESDRNTEMCVFTQGNFHCIINNNLVKLFVPDFSGAQLKHEAGNWGSL